MLDRIKEFLKWMRGWRTMIVAVILGSIDTLEALDLAPIIPDKFKPWWMVLHPIIFAYLRFISTTPVGSKEPAVTVKQMAGGK